jgi:hypothetical protein
MWKEVEFPCRDWKRNLSGYWLPLTGLQWSIGLMQVRNFISWVSSFSDLLIRTSWTHWISSSLSCRDLVASLQTEWSKFLSINSAQFGKQHSSLFNLHSDRLTSLQWLLLKATVTDGNLVSHFNISVTREYRFERWKRFLPLWKFVEHVLSHFGSSVNTSCFATEFRWTRPLSLRKFA